MKVTKEQANIARKALKDFAAQRRADATVAYNTWKTSASQRDMAIYQRAKDEANATEFVAARIQASDQAGQTDGQ